jgi:hypothetical protein
MPKIHIGKMDWPGPRLSNSEEGKSIIIAEPTGGIAGVSRLRFGLWLEKPVQLPDGITAEYGESFENDEWWIYTIPPTGRALAHNESSTPKEVLDLAKWLSHRFDCAGGVWYRVNADLPSYIEFKINKPHNLSAEELTFPTEFITDLCEKICEHFSG